MTVDIAARLVNLAPSILEDVVRHGIVGLEKSQVSAMFQCRSIEFLGLESHLAGFVGDGFVVYNKPMMTREYASSKVAKENILPAPCCSRMITVVL